MHVEVVDSFMSNVPVHKIIAIEVVIYFLKKNINK